jgi:hypothetical protein
VVIFSPAGPSRAGSGVESSPPTRGRSFSADLSRSSDLAALAPATSPKPPPVPSSRTLGCGAQPGSEQPLRRQQRDMMAGSAIDLQTLAQGEGVPFAALADREGVSRSYCGPQRRSAAIWQADVPAPLHTARCGTVGGTGRSGENARELRAPSPPASRDNRCPHCGLQRRNGRAC